MEITFILALIIIVVIYVVQAGNEEAETKKRNAEKIRGGEVNNFVPTQVIDSMWVDAAIYIDEANKKILVVKSMKKDAFWGNPIRFNELIECSILEDGATVQSGGIGRAVVGGVFAGGIGAVVGAATRSSKPITRELAVRIITSNIQNSLYIVPIITCETNRETNAYKQKMEFAQKVYATITSIIYSNQIASTPIKEEN